MRTTWPNSRDFWKDKRVVVTGGSGFLGSYVVEKLHATRGSAQVVVPRRVDYDLRVLENIRRLLRDATARYRYSSGSASRRHWRESRAPGGILLRQPHDGRAAPSRKLGRRSKEVRRARNDLLLSQTHPDSFQGRGTCGTATRKRPTRRTGSPRRCSSCSPRRTAAVRIQQHLPDAGEPLRTA